MINNGALSDTLYAYSNNNPLSVVTPRKIGGENSDIISPSIWLFIPTDVINHRGKLKFLGVSDDYRDPFDKVRFSIQGGTEFVPNIIYNNFFHDEELIKKWNKKLERKLK